MDEAEAVARDLLSLAEVERPASCAPWRDCDVSGFAALVRLYGDRRAGAMRSRAALECSMQCEYPNCQRAYGLAGCAHCEDAKAILALPLTEDEPHSP